MSVVVTGGIRLGMMMALAKCCAVCGTTSRMAAPSRRCRCQSSGVVMVSVAALLATPRRAADAYLL
jgi:hypothetical protein